jgi:hypothetical protein
MEFAQIMFKSGDKVILKSLKEINRIRKIYYYPQIRNSYITQLCNKLVIIKDIFEPPNNVIRYTIEEYKYYSFFEDCFISFFEDCFISFNKFKKLKEVL